MKNLIQIEVPSRINKSGIKTMAVELVSNSIESGNILQLAEGIAVIEKVAKAIREQADFTNAVVDELRLYKGGFTSPNGATIEPTEAGVSYDYSQDEEWKMYKHYENKYAEQRKAREAVLKKAKDGEMAIDEETGELIVGANRKSKSTYKITLPK